MLARLSLAAAATALAAALAPVAIAAEGSHDGDTVIVSFRPDVERPRELPVLERAGVERTVDRIASLAASVVRVEGEPAAVAERLEASPKVAYAEPNDIYTAQASAPNDASFNRLWGLHNTGQTGGRPGADIAAVRGWEEARVGHYPARGGAPVGIVDTGIDRAHPDLLGRVSRCREEVMAYLATGSCLDDTGHGTHVAGILGAAADNGVGVTGVAFNSPLLVCRALGGEKQQGRASDIAKCILWAHERGARVISMSFAGNRNQTLHRAIRRAWKGGRPGGSVLVSSAGNGGFDVPVFPAAYDEVMSVSATNDRDGLASFSNRHRTVDVAAPGADILSTTRGGGYTRLSGTSMSVPYVSGVAAHVRRLHPRWPASGVRQAIRESANDLGPRGHDARFGFGRVNLARAARR
jgi:thermitase